MVGLPSLAVLFTVLPSVIGATGLSGLNGLLQRRIPQHVNSFHFNLVNGTGDAFSISNTAGKTGEITIECTTLSSCARGLYTYCTEVGGVDIWWTGSRLHELPLQLPKVNKPITGSSIVPWRYHFNTVTFGYTTAFWDFEKWELLLDWLALRGVNLPLAWNGYEAILIDVFHEFGLSDEEIFDFLSGPAFLPWNRFGNIQSSWGGPLPMQWVTDQFNLQKNQILPRMLELGMTPILPSFTGFVPRAMRTHYPNASIINGSQWSGISEVLSNDTFVQPFDPLFPQMQKSFLTKQQAAYGNITHFYTLDQYNENDPFSGNISYLSSISEGTISSLRAVDPDAVWVLQGWLFYASSAFWTNDRIEAYLGSAPDDSMLILDLWSEGAPQWNRTDSYFGKPWVWCELHDYGGNLGMEGNLHEVLNGPVEALHSNGSTMAGMGLTMEGQEPGNEVVYDALLDQAWSASPLDLVDYVTKWAARRYQTKTLPSTIAKAWEIVGSTVYNNSDPSTQSTVRSIVEVAPGLGLDTVNFAGRRLTFVPYDTNTTIVPALKLLVNASKSTPSLRNVPEFVFDVTEFSRQILANRFLEMYTNLISIWNSTSASPNAVATAGARMVDLLGDMDTLLYTNENYLLSTWIADAKQWGKGNASYEAFLEYQARNQITLWGPTGGVINDYAGKQWAGLVGEYYAPRWKKFVSLLVDQKTSGEPYNATLVADTMETLGEQFDLKRWGDAPGEIWGTKGDTWEAVETVLKKWV
ncbi:glycoside hydrolase family 89 protein [Trametopsis cervina]|nr:glycoside hydrolase family 89 protein [Trametopsis cervina]